MYIKLSLSIPIKSFASIDKYLLFRLLHVAHILCPSVQVYSDLFRGISSHFIHAMYLRNFSSHISTKFDGTEIVNLIYCVENK